MEKSRLKIIIFLFSITAAAFIANYLIASGFNIKYLSIDMHDVYAVLSDEGVSVYMLTIFQRIKQFIIIVLIFKFINTEAAVMVFIFMAGLLTGIMISVESFYEGMTGVVYCILCTFPHFIFYILNIKLICKYYESKDKTRHIQDIERIKYISMSILIFILGLGSELIVNRIFLKNFYQYIVLN